MAAPKSKDPKDAISITIPRTLLRASKKAAECQRISISAWISERIREHVEATR